MRQILTKILLASALLVTANAGEKFSDLTKDYLNNNASVDVRKTIAKDPETAIKTLKILTEDSDSVVREYANNNLN